MISIVIVNYHLSREILACLDSLERHIPRHRFRVIVVDNGSTDPALSALRQRVAANCDWRFLDIGENIGFGAACNRGARETDSPWLCFLNPDTTVDDDFLHCLVDVAESTGAALVGPSYGPPRWMEWNTGRFPGLLLECLSIAMLGRHIEALWMGIRRRLGGDRPMAVDWVLGACMLMPRRWFDTTGGFDESFFLYYEEMDLCRRIHDAGGEVLFAPACRIRHTGSVSGKRDYRAFTRRFFEGKLHYLYKHHQGVMAGLMRTIVRLQLDSQRLLWRLPPFHTQARAEAKRAGIADVLSMMRLGFPWETR